MNFEYWLLPAQSYSAETGLVERVLCSRGMTDPVDKDRFLSDQPLFHDPMLLPDMEEAVRRLRRAIDDGERILVFGDFDCDGVTATVMLYDYLENCCADVLYYIPERETEGYGLRIDTLQRVIAAGVSLMITVDNGVTALNELEWAAQNGLDVIVTDHHKPKELLPRAVAVVDPHRMDSIYPFNGLCGAGVAFALICAVEQADPDLIFEQYGDLLALATVADVVPLTGENRWIVRQGMRLLAETQRPGLSALAQAAGLDLSTEDAELISYGLAPRINAAGRIGRVDDAVELLLCEDEQRAVELAQTLEQLNRRRKEIERDITDQALGQLTLDPAVARRRVLIVAGEDWHCGVIGITAARLVQRFHKPCIVFSQIDGELRGSARSVEGFSMIQAIRSAEQYLVRAGGHAMAAGVTVKQEHFDSFSQAVEQWAAQHFEQMPVPKITLDAGLRLSEITLSAVKELQILAPFGEGNPKPVFWVGGVQLRSVTPIGNGKHLRLQLAQGNTLVDAVFFGMPLQSFPFAVGEIIDCAVQLVSSFYNGTERVSIRLLDLHPAGFSDSDRYQRLQAYDALARGEHPVLPDSCTLNREQLAIVFRFLREKTPCQLEVDGIAHRLSPHINVFQVKAVLDILLELGLIEVNNQEGRQIVSVLPAKGKADLMNSVIYSALQPRG